jgi:hypothetical protein
MVNSKKKYSFLIGVGLVELSEVEVLLRVYLIDSVSALTGRNNVVREI